MSILTNQLEDESEGGESDKDATVNYKIPQDVEVFEITGPLFFGAAYKFKDAIRFIERTPKVLIIRMRHVPIIDATGIHILKEVFKDVKNRGTKIILSGITSEQVVEELQKSRLIFAVGKANIVTSFEQAVQRSKELLEDMSHKQNR